MKTLQLDSGEKRKDDTADCRIKSGAVAAVIVAWL